MNETGGDRPNDDGLEGLDLGGNASREMEVEQPRRAASVTLRDEAEADRRAASLEAAQRSLSDALRITYRLMQVLIVALVVLFLFSGFRQVSENESAVKTRFGAVVEREIAPGFTISLPYPLGEVRTVSSADSTIVVREPFFPFLTDAQGRQDFATLRSGGEMSFNPIRSGSLITGDGNLAHMRLSVTYRRADATEYLRNLNPADEARLVAQAARAAAVRVAAGEPIESIVGEALAGLVSESEAGEDDERDPARAGDVGIEQVQRRIRELTQERLDAINSGLQVSSVIALDPFPPLRVLQQFTQVEQQIADSREVLDSLEREATRTLVEGAGEDYEKYLELIDLYEDATAEGNDELADQVFDAIRDAMTGEYTTTPVVIGDRDFGTIAAGGEATDIIRAAEADVDQAVRRAEAEHRRFLVKLEQMRDNPSVFFTRERTDALRAFFESDAIDIVPFAAAGVRDVRLLINNDPEVRREQERIRNSQERREAMERREAEAFADR